MKTSIEGYKEEIKDVFDVRLYVNVGNSESGFG